MGMADFDDVIRWIGEYINRSIGLGIIIRDKLGLVKAATSLYLKAMLSPSIAKALAVWRGVVLAMENGLVPFHIETDSLQVSDLVNKCLVSHAEIGSTISLILSSFEKVHVCVVSHVS
ncbi:hypothetical protein QYF36_022620 [Acer negundo]|nr:hypothetical protein QYF36_022620 [Acer negundo]